MDDDGENLLWNAVLPSVLWSGFCTGKAISTVLLVARGTTTATSNDHDDDISGAVYASCRGALVQRYRDLSTRLQGHDEICDVLDVLCVDIRVSTERNSNKYNNGTGIQKFSEWCAILDYFEAQLFVASHAALRQPQWMVWNGTMEIPYGEMQAHLITPDWSVGALSFWRTAELASNLALTHPNQSDFWFRDTYHIPYGTLLGNSVLDRRRMNMQCRDIEVSPVREIHIESRRFALVPQNEAYEIDPGIVFVHHGFVSLTHENLDVGPLLISEKNTESLVCCWNKEDEEEEWEEAIQCLGEHVIRIMNNFTTEGEKSFHEAILEYYAGLSEFSNKDEH